jgi:NitT/TauT family transport system substrate-binding protein
MTAATYFRRLRAEAMHIRMAENFRAVFYAPFYAGRALGFYADEGVEVEWRGAATPGEGVAGLLDGTVDLTWGGPMRVMKARDTQPDSTLVCFCEVVARDPFCLVGRSRQRTFRLADLPRLRFAAVAEVPTPWMCLQHDLREEGIDPSRLDRAPDRSMGENLAALRRGEVDVVQLFEPYVSIALQEGIGDVLYAAASRGETVYTSFIATRAGIARQRPAFAGMVRAISRMQAWLAAHTAEEIAAIVAPFFPEIVPAVLELSLRRYREAGIWSARPEISRQGFSQLADSLRSGGFISGTPRYEECVYQEV